MPKPKQPDAPKAWIVINGKYQQNPEYVRWWRKKNPERVNAQQREYYRKNKQKWKVHQKIWREKNKEIKRAEGKIQNRRGKIPFPIAEFCELCPEDDRRKAKQRHHPDYDEPTIYISLCNPCHYYANRGEF